MRTPPHYDISSPFILKTFQSSPLLPNPFRGLWDRYIHDYMYVSTYLRELSFIPLLNQFRSFCLNAKMAKTPLLSIYPPTSFSFGVIILHNKTVVPCEKVMFITYTQLEQQDLLTKLGNKFFGPSCSFICCKKVGDELFLPIEGHLGSVPSRFSSSSDLYLTFIENLPD